MHARGREGGGLPFQVPEQRCAKQTGANRFASLQRPHTFHHVFRGSFFRQITVNSRAHALQKFRFSSRHTNQENLHLPGRRPHPSDRIQVLVSFSTRRVHQHVSLFP